MIASSIASTDWGPEGFERYRELYPLTPALVPPPDGFFSELFACVWREGSAGEHVRALASRARSTTVVFVRGYLGNYMPGNLGAARDAVRQLGFDAVIVRNRAGGTVAGNVAMIARQLERRRLRERLVFCGHSRGGVEALTLLARDPVLARRCDGVALSQTPRGPSRVMESVLLGRHRDSLRGVRRRAAEATQTVALAIIGARAGGRELTSDVWPTIAKRLDRTWPFPVLQMASWSSRPTAWLDSFHERLREIGPGRAHDGQFFLEDLIWPALPHVLLPDLDHSQPAVGGYGFDTARYWVATLAVLLNDVVATTSNRGRDCR